MKVSELMSNNVEWMKKNQQTWSIFYNLKEWGAVGDNVHDDKPIFDKIIQALGGENGMIIVPKGTFRIGSSLVIPENVSLYFVGEGILSPVTTLIINGPIIAGPFQIFSGVGTTTGSHAIVDRLFPQWWGAKGDGITDDTLSITKTRQMAHEGSTIYFLSGTYLVYDEDLLTNPSGSRYLAEGYSSNFLYEGTLYPIPTFTTIASLGPDKMVGTDSGGALTTYDISASMIASLPGQINDLHNEDDILHNEINTVNNRVSTIIAHNGDGTKDTEIIDARGSFDVLSDRLNNTDKRLDESLISITSFGAIGDGITDSSQAVYDAFLYCITHKKRLFIPNGIFIVDANKIDIPIPEHGISIIGVGRQSVIKRKAGTSLVDWKVLFRFRPAEDTIVESITIENLHVDSNARENPLPDPDSPYDLEHNADFYFAGYSDTSYIKRVGIFNVTCEDAIADHFYFAGSTRCFVEHIQIDNFFADKRTRTRADICITGKPTTLKASNIDCQNFEYEINNYSEFKSTFDMSNVTCSNILDIAGDLRTNDIKETLTANLVNVHAKNFMIGGMTVHCVNCRFEARETRRLVKLLNSTFDNCEFIFNVEETPGDFLEFQYSNHNIRITNCEFKFGNETISRTDTHSWINRLPCGTNLENDFSNAYFTNCTFGKGMKYGIRLNRGGFIESKNNTFNTDFAYHYHSVKMTSGDLNRTTARLLIDGGFYNVNTFMHGEGESYTNPDIRDNMDWIIIRNVKVNADKTTRIFQQANSNFIYLNYAEVDMVCYSKNAPTTNLSKLKGMRWEKIYHGDQDLSKPWRWLAIKFNTVNTSSPNSNSWLVDCVCKGNTADRPTTAQIVSEYMEYFDTTLNKPIYWTGTNWRDATGTVV